MYKKKTQNAMNPYQRNMCAKMESKSMAVTLPLTIEKLRPGSWYVKLPSPAPNAGNWFLLCCYSPLRGRVRTNVKACIKQKLPLLSEIGQGGRFEGSFSPIRTLLAAAINWNPSSIYQRNLNVKTVWKCNTFSIPLWISHTDHVSIHNCEITVAPKQLLF